MTGTKLITFRYLSFSFLDMKCVELLNGEDMISST